MKPGQLLAALYLGIHRAAAATNEAVATHGPSSREASAARARRDGMLRTSKTILNDN